MSIAPFDAYPYLYCFLQALVNIFLIVSSSHFILWQIEGLILHLESYEDHFKTQHDRFLPSFILITINGVRCSTLKSSTPSCRSIYIIPHTAKNYYFHCNFNLRYPHRHTNTVEHRSICFKVFLIQRCTVYYFIYIKKPSIIILRFFKNKKEVHRTPLTSKFHSLL